MSQKFYEKFNQKSKKSKEIAQKRSERKEFNKERDEYFSKKREQKGSKEVFINSKQNQKISLDAEVVSVSDMFDFKKLPDDARIVLENFDRIVQSVRPMNSKQLAKLPKDIRELSHKLTDDRESRRVGYMNATEELSAYVRYFTWWNLVRLTRVFSNIPAEQFNLKDEDVCLDIGSGPLTVVSALWLSRPELRSKKLTFYCMDISASTMALGEDIYMSIAAQSQPKESTAPAHWNIVRVKGEIGTPIRKKAKFISCANMFNELYQKEKQDPEKIAKAQFDQLKAYAQPDPVFFIAEPGSPVASHFISLMRQNMLKEGLKMVAPCPHQDTCAMSGLHARYGGTAKWCNYSFSTEQAPLRLLKLSEEAGIPKDRAVISFIFANNAENITNNFSIRVSSEPIWLPGNRQGFYCCSSKGLVLAVNCSRKELKSGQCLELNLKTGFNDLQKDKKTGSILINI